jgi:hypothetical protein
MQLHALKPLECGLDEPAEAGKFTSTLPDLASLMPKGLATGRRVMWRDWGDGACESKCDVLTLSCCFAAENVCDVTKVIFM